MIQNYIVDKLTLSDLNQTGKVIIPNFQRGVVWTKAHRKEFIETVKSGDPFGVVLVSQEKPSAPYYLIDGLQRLSTLNAYMANPLDFIDENDKFIDKNKLHDIFVEKYRTLGIQLPSEFKLEKEKKSFLKKMIGLMKGKDSLPSETDMWKNSLAAQLGVSVDKFDVFSSFSEFYKLFVNNLKLPDIIIHAIVYQGPKERLPYVFETLNTSSVSLTKYEVFASQWPTIKYVITDEELINSVWNKYASLKASSSFEVDAELEDLKKNGITLFEYCFGFSELICSPTNDYSFLFTRGKKTTDPTGFELLSLACGLPVNKADDLWESKYLGNASSSFLVDLKKALNDSICIVAKALKPWVLDLNDTYIKGVGTYQIYYMIISVFNQKYDLDLTNKTITVRQACDKEIIKFNKFAHKWYLYQIITGFWNKNRQVSDLRNCIDSADKSPYFSDISQEYWKKALDSFEYETNTRTIPDELRLLLNYYYQLMIKRDANLLKYFCKKTDEGDEIAFDIEHIVPCNKFEDKKNKGLPMTTLGNLCYLPVKDNRSKRDKTIYEYALDRPSLTYNDSFIQTIKYPSREELSFIDCAYDQFIQPYTTLVEKRAQDIIEEFISLMI